MGNVSLWTYSVILLCLGGITFGQRFQFENPSNGYRNGPPKLNLRNFLGSRLIQKLADNNNGPQFQSFEQAPVQYAAPLPPPPPPPPPPQQPSFSRGVAQFEYSQPRIPAPPMPSYASMGPPQQGMGMQQEQGSQNMGFPQQNVGFSQQNIGFPPRNIGMPPQNMGPPPRNVGPPSHGSPSHQMEEDNVYTETITSPCPTCGMCSECEAANQDYSYPDESCPCCACSGGGCPCERGECPCSCGREGPPKGHCPCSGGGNCPCCSGGDNSYSSDVDYPDRDQNYDDYPSSGDCPTCCECARNNDYPDEPQTPPAFVRDHPTYERLPPANENYMQGPAETQKFGGMMNPPFKSIPQREIPQPPPRFQQYEPMEPPMFMKGPPRMKGMQRTFMPPPMQQPEMPEQHLPPIPQPQEGLMQHPHLNVPERTVQHTEVSERRFEQTQQVQIQPIEPYPMPQDGPPIPRHNDWRQVPRMPPPPRVMMDHERHMSEPPVPMYQSYQPVRNRYGRKYRQPMKPAFFEGLSYSDGC